MLDRKFIVENTDAVIQNCSHRGVKVDVTTLVTLEDKRRQLLQSVQELNRQANEVSKTIGTAKDPAEREARKEEGRALREKKDAAQTEHDALEVQILELQKQIPNMTHPAAPVGGGDDANRVVGHGKHPRPTFDFAIADHVALAERHHLIDLKGGAQVAGHGFYYLMNDAVLLELALQQFAVQFLLQRGFTPMITPDLARNEILQGIGFNPRGNETQIYSIENTDLCLVATAEITLGGLYSGHIFEAEQLPLRICGISHCYRTEAGAHGRTTRGIYRVHQFTKVEMFGFALPEQSDAMLEELRGYECEIFDALELHYQVIDTATGDLGGPAYRKYDLEAWMPGRGEAGEYGEVTSTSNCTDYQARRLNIRYKNAGEKGTHFVHTLNGTAVSIARALIAILENHQRADGSIRVPKVLQPWVGKELIGQ
jgi:seryl-tRNA synthetase